MNMRFAKAAVAVGIAAAAALGYVAYENLAIGITRYDITGENFPEGLSELKICHLSDIHVKTNPRDYGQLIKAAAKCEPDIITVSGDLVDSRVSDISAAVSLMETLTDIAPVYYVTGNHEERLPTDLYFKVIEDLRAAGVRVLEDCAEIYEKNGCRINIIGMFDREYPDCDMLSGLIEPGLFNVLVCHRPQFAESYAAYGASLALCGHAHGGQARLPFIGGIIAPDQGFFPDYYEGVHEINGRYTVISRGIGNSIIPVRINNRPEVLLITARGR